MKKLIAFSLIIAVQFFFMPFSPAHAATTPGLGQAASFSILSGTYTNTVGGTTLNGDLGYTTGPAMAPTVNGSTYSPPDSKYTQAGIDQATALADLNAQACTPIGAIVTLDSYDIDGAGPIAPGTFTPGCYSSTGAMNITAGTTVTLSGAGTFIFRPDGALTTGANSSVSLGGGAAACNIFWTPTAAATLGATSSFTGTIIDDSGITIGSSVTWTGRALAFGGTVSSNADTLTVPTCSTTSTTSSSSSDSTDEGEDEDDEHAIKVSKKASPVALYSGPGDVTYTYKVTNEGDDSLNDIFLKDDKCSEVTYVSGDDNHNSRLGVNETWIYTCTKRVSQTETNKATVRGAPSRNGDYVTDTDKATVVVSIPTLPNAGFGPQ